MGIMQPRLYRDIDGKNNLKLIEDDELCVHPKKFEKMKKRAKKVTIN
jgi:hypothetical protein